MKALNCHAYCVCARVCVCECVCVRVLECIPVMFVALAAAVASCSARPGPKLGY